MVAEPVEEAAPEPLRLSEAMLASLGAFELLTEQAVSDAMVAALFRASRFHLGDR